MNIIKRLLKFKFFNEAVYRLYYFPNKIIGASHLFKTFLRNRKNKGQPIKVVIIVQLPTLWGKVETLYDEMCKSKDFDVFLLSIPNYKFLESSPEYSSMDNKAYDFLENKNLKSIKANTSKGWYNLKDLAPDYVFYPRPYDSYMPTEYKSKKVSNFTRICYIPYGYSLAKSLMRNSFDVRFFSNLSIYFSENFEFLKYNYYRFRFTHFLRLRKTVNIGYPVLENVLNHETTECEYWKANETRFKAIWTPRWTVDDTYGNSNFFSYKTPLVDFFKNDNTISLVARPHPLAFQNFLELGLMDELQLTDFKNQFDNKRLFLDQESSYHATMWCSDVLITDFSSVIVEYFIMGKPIIYCSSSIEPTVYFKEILGACYIANDFSDIKKYISQLKNGVDPLKSKRLEIVKKVCNPTLHKDASENICAILKER